MNTWTWDTVAALAVLTITIWIIASWAIIEHETHTDQEHRQRWLNAHRDNIAEGVDVDRGTAPSAGPSTPTAPSDDAA